MNEDSDSNKTKIDPIAKWIIILTLIFIVPPLMPFIIAALGILIVIITILLGIPICLLGLSYMWFELREAEKKYNKQEEKEDQ